MNKKANKILYLNAYIKYVEFILHNFDHAKPSKTIKEIREEFEEKFKTIHPLLNQNFGIFRLIPLILIKEIYKNEKKELSGDIKKIKTIRDSIAHGNFYINENGYEFKNDKDEIKLSFQEFNDFVFKIENIFYTENISSQSNVA